MSADKNYIGKSYILLLLSILFINFGCKKDSSGSNNGGEINPTPFIENFGSQITRDFLGKVTTKEGIPLENAQVSIGSQFTTTDENGVFMINNATVYEKLGYVRAERIGYINGSRSVIPTNGPNVVNIILLRKEVTQTVSSGTVETVNLGNGASVTLEGMYSKADGSSYSGDVYVSLHHLNPSDESIRNEMPGMLFGQDSQNNPSMLQTYGMLSVELTGTAGEELNISTGSTASITMPLDGTMAANAPSQIPLWWFDEDNGYWVEEGQATLQGNSYVGNVPHFSFWNCDVSAGAVDLCITTFDQNQNPVEGIYAEINTQNYGTRGGVSNANGEICGWVPENETLDVEYFYSTTCTIGSGNVPIGISSTFGPYAANSSQTESVTVPNNTIIETLSGTFNDCSGNPISQGYVQLTIGQCTYVSQVTNGLFSFNFAVSTANSTISIEGFDYLNIQGTGAINYTLTTPNTNIGTIAACSSVSEFIQYSIDGGQIEEFFLDSNLIDAYDNANNQGGLGVTIVANNGTTCFYLNSIYNTQYPNYEGSYSFGLNNPGEMYTYECFEIDVNSPTTIVFNLSQYAQNIGDYYDINFSGDYYDYQGVQRTVDGIIHVKRDQ